MRYLIIILVMSYGQMLIGQSIIGQWETFDDNTNEKKSIVEIYEVDEVYFARIIDVSIEDKDVICEVCSDAKKNKPIVGLVIIENLKKDRDQYKGGSILDPESGKTYKCKLELQGENKLKVRGFLGVAFLGRTQYWSRK